MGVGGGISTESAKNRLSVVGEIMKRNDENSQQQCGVQFDECVFKIVSYKSNIRLKYVFLSSIELGTWELK